MKKTAQLFKNLGHPIRLKILCLLAREGRQCVCKMLPEVGGPQPTLSRHLALLKSHGLIDDEREGTLVFYRISDPSVLDVMRAAGLPCACAKNQERAIPSPKAPVMLRRRPGQTGPAVEPLLNVKGKR